MAYIGNNEVLFSPIINIVEQVTGGGVKDYAEDGVYNAGEIVYYSGTIYTPIENNVTGVLPTDTSKWKELTSGKQDALKDESGGAIETTTATEDEINSIFN